MEVAAARREAGDLGGMITIQKTFTIPCSMGSDVIGLQPADSSAGVSMNQTRRVLIRTCLLSGLSRQPNSGDTVTVKGNLEDKGIDLIIAPLNGVEKFNAILTAFNLYNPNA